MASPFNKKVGKKIDKEKADKQISNWKKFGLKTQSNFFGLDVINELIATPGCIGIRIHHALDDEGNMQPVLTPEVEDAQAKAKAETFYDASYPCPPYC
jgi:hypothetical protein